MPTTRARYIVTETDEIAAALDQAAERWPDDRDSRKKLLLDLVELGHQKLEDDAIEADRRARIRTAREELAGSMTGMFGPDYLKKLRDEWPD